MCMVWPNTATYLMKTKKSSNGAGRKVTPAILMAGFKDKSIKKTRAEGTE